MADDSIILKVEINGVEKEIKNIKELRTARKQLQDEFIAGNHEAAKSIGELDKKLEDLGKATNTFRSSGVENLTSSFSIFKEGFEKFDIEKIKTGFKGLGAAMSAIPIFLLIEGIKLLIENFDVVIDVAKNFLGITNDNEVAVQRLISAIDRESEALKNFQAVSDAATTTELLNAKRRGASEEELTNITVAGYQRRIKEAKANLEFQTDAYNRLLKLSNASAEEIKKAGEAQLSANATVKKLTSDLNNFKIQSQIDTDKRAEEEDKKATDKYKQELEKRKQAKEQADKEFNTLLSQSLADEQAALDAEAKAIDDRQKIRDAQRLAGLKLLADQEKELRDQAVADAEKAASDDLALAQKVSDGKKQLRQDEYNASKNLSDLFFQIQLNNALGNSKRETEIRKRQFVVEKSFKVAQITMDGIQGSVKAYAMNPLPSPIGITSAILQGVAAAAAAAKVLSTKFDAGSPSAPGSSTIPTGNIPDAPPPPQFSTPNAGSSTTLTQPAPVKAYVVETEITGKQEVIQKIERQSHF